MFASPVASKKPNDGMRSPAPASGGNFADNEVYASTIRRGLEYDEQSVYFLDNMESSNSGFYHYPSEGKNTSRMNTGRAQAQNASGVKLRPRGKLTLLPTALRRRCQQVKWKSFAGLLPQLNYAYITVDSTLFLWNYETGECKEYSRLGQIIVSLALVKPKPGIFHEKIKYVIVLATPVEIVMLGCVFDNDNVNGELSLFETQFYIPSDNTPILKIIGSDTGRIFLCGKDGCVYELIYQARDGWFSRKVRKLNHSHSILRSFLPSFLFGSVDDPVLDLLIDETRNPVLLFSFSKSIKTNQHRIAVWSLGEHGDQMVMKTSVDNILKSVESHVVSVPDRQDFKIVSLATIPRSESESIVLVAVTNHGFRIFFALNVNSHSGSWTLGVKFVRSCPPYIKAPEGDHQPRSFLPEYKDDFSPRACQKAYYHKGVLLLSDNRSDRGDTLVAITQEFVKQTHTSHATLLNEMVQSVGEFPRIHDIQEKPLNFYLYSSPGNYASFLYARGYAMPLDGLREFAVQHVLPNRQFICLTVDGIQTYEKTWPVDELRQILLKMGDNISSGPSDTLELQQFFDNYMVKEVCAMCLVIACSTPRHLQLANKLDQRSHVARNREQKYADQSFQHLTEDSARLKRLATAVFFEEGGNSGSTTDIKSPLRHHVHDSSPLFSQDFSGIHDGLALYMSRILRPLWDWSIAQNVGTVKKPVLRLRFNAEHMSTLLAPLLALQVFVDRNYGRFFNRGGNSSQGQQLNNNNNANRGGGFQGRGYGGQQHQQPHLDSNGNPSPLQHELDSLKGLINFYHLCLEAVSLFSIISDQTKPNFTDIVENLRVTKRYQTEYEALCDDFKFYRFVTSDIGKKVAKSLIAGVLTPILDPQNKSQNAQLIIEKLSAECPSFFSASDRLHYQALEKLQRAQASSPHHKVKIHNEALSLYYQSAMNTEFNLGSICRNLCEEQFFKGAVKLALERIKLLFSGDVMLPSAAAANTSSTGVYVEPQDPEEFLDQELNKCYDAITSTLQTLILSEHIQVSDRERRTIRVIDICLQSDYRSLHNVIYDWLIECDQRDRLYSLQYRSLVTFLTTRIREGFLASMDSKQQRGQNDERMYLEILRKYYLRNEMWESATVLLDELSQRKSSRWTLAERITMLNEAFLCAKKCVDMANLGAENNPPRTLGDVIDNLRDRIQLADVQAQIFKTLSARHEAVSHQHNSDHKSESHKLETVIVELNETLLDIDKLYHHAMDFMLFECCLAILNLTPHKEKFSNVISVLWTNVIRYCIAQDKEHWGEAVRGKLNQLCPLYCFTPSMFPLDVIVEQLEKSNVEHKRSYDDQWVMAVLLDRTGGNLDPTMLLNVYSTMEFPAKQQHKVARCWSVAHLLAALLQNVFKIKQKHGSTASLMWEVLNRAKTELTPDSSDNRERSVYAKLQRLEDMVYNLDSQGF